MKLEFETGIFDMDGTILDSLGVWEKIDYDFLKKKRNIDVPNDYMESIAHLSFYETAIYTKERFALNETPQQLMEEWNEMAINEYTYNVKLKSHVKDYLYQLKQKGKQMILCTSSPKYLYVPVLKNNGIFDLFDGFVSTCEVNLGKNNPDVYLLAAKKAKTSPHNCMVFEDIPGAITGAKKAKMQVCGVYDKYSENNRAKCQ